MLLVSVTEGGSFTIHVNIVLPVSEMRVIHQILVPLPSSLLHLPLLAVAQIIVSLSLGHSPTCVVLVSDYTTFMLNSGLDMFVQG